MMDHITTADLEQLVDAGEPPRVSVYLPMHRKGPETQKNPLVLKSAIKRITGELEDRDMRRPDIESFLQPATKLLGDTDFWQHQEDGLALFIDRQGMWSYRLPQEFDELVSVSNRFHLKPLLPLLSFDQEFYVLALSHNQVRLLRGSRWRVSELELAEVPTSLKEALWYREPEAALQSHASSRGSGAMIFHGHGLGKESSDDDLSEFFRQVDRGIRSIITDGQVPVVLAGVGYLLPLYRKVSELRIVDEAIEGNPERLSAETLHERAWPLVSEPHEAALREAREKFEASKPGTTAWTTEDVVSAAAQGRVETLFVPRGIQRWGSFDPETFAVEVTEENGASDLYDIAAVRTWQTGGDVFVVDRDEVPGEGEVAAVLRF